MTTTKRQQIITGLRALADMLEDEAVPLPYNVQADAFWQYTPEGHLGERVSTDDARLAMTAVPGCWSKTYDASFVSYVRQLSEFVSYEISIPREQVCTRVSVGEKVIPAQPERVETVYEWQCDDDRPEITPPTPDDIFASIERSAQR